MYTERVKQAVDKHNAAIHGVTATAVQIAAAHVARLFTIAYRDAIEKKLESPLDAACTAAGMTRSHILDHLNRFLMCIAPRRKNYRHEFDGKVFGGAIRDWFFLNRFPNDLDVLIPSDNPYSSLMIAFDAILARYHDCRIEATVVGPSDLYGGAKTAQLRIRVIHPLNPILTINADISFGPEHTGKPDFDVNALAMEIPLDPRGSVMVACGSVDYIYLGDIASCIKLLHMRRHCIQGHVRSCEAQDRRREHMIRKGFTDYTVYDCRDPKCVRASDDAKKEWIETMYATEPRLQQIRKSCIGAFRDANMTLDPAADDAHRDAEYKRIEAHRETCTACRDNGDCQECDLRELPGNSITMPMILYTAVDEALREFVRELLGRYKDSSDSCTNDRSQFAQYVAGALSDTPACAARILCMVKEHVNNTECILDSHIIGRERVDELSKLQHYKIVEELPRGAIVDYVPVDMTVHGKLIGTMTLRDIIETYQSRVRSVNYDSLCKLLADGRFDGRIRSIANRYVDFGYPL